MRLTSPDRRLALMNKDTPPFWETPVRLPIDGVLDLHTFQPSELSALLFDYLEACQQEGLREIRIIHGKGRGILRRRVRRLLAEHPDVQSYQDAPVHAGGWGATEVVLRQPT